MILCKNCGNPVADKFCGHCGLAVNVKRITLKGLLHDVFHFFTHLDKGFAYTFKSLIRRPGKMQLEYIEGNRAAHQKPFSMFFICATVAGLVRYWINLALVNYYHAGDVTEGNFFHEYMVLLQIALMPLFTLIAWLLFYRSQYNYAEIGVLSLYTWSAFFILVTLISLLRFIWRDMDTMWVELPVLGIYNSITLVNFFKRQRSWIVILKAIFILVILFLIVQLCEDLIIRLMKSS